MVAGEWLVAYTCFVVVRFWVEMSWTIGPRYAVVFSRSVQENCKRLPQIGRDHFRLHRF
jgi:hypothetical protein